MVVKVRLENGRETWLDPTNTETIKAIENQYGSKVVLIDGKARMEQAKQGAKTTSKKKFIGVPEIPGYVFHWFEQKAQYDGSKPKIIKYADRNKPLPKEKLKVKQAEGIEYFKGEMSNNRWVDALLYKNKYGQIIGILNHYPFDFPPYEKKGNINVMVAPKEQGKGIGLKLVKEALNRYPDIDLYQQEWTPQGQSLLKQIGADKNYFKFFQEYAINEKYTKKMTDIGVDKETNDNSIYDSNKDEIQIFTKYNNLKQLWYISGTQLMKCKTLMDFTKSLKKRGTMKERKAEHGIKFEQYDDEYQSQYDWLVKTITNFFGQMNVNRSSADWGGIDNWTIKGGMYEGIFIIIDDDNKVFLMERKHNEETDEYENTDLAEAEPSETKELEVLFKKAMSIKEEKLGSGDKAEHGKKVSEMNNEDKVQKYIDYYMNGDMSVIFDTIGLDMPTELEGDEYEETMELAREQADRIFTLNPDMMTNKFGDPFDFSLATDKAKKGIKIGENGGFIKDDQGNYKNSKGFELINQFDGTYQVLDKNGMDISGEYETLKQAKQTIKDFEFFDNQDQTMKTGGRFDKVKQMALLTMKPFAFKQKAQFLKENPEMFAGKVFDNGGGVGEDKLELFYVMDNNGNVKNISKSYEKANDFLEKSLKLNGKIGYKNVLKSDWDAEKINTSNIKKFANGGGVGMTKGVIKDSKLIFSGGRSHGYKDVFYILYEKWAELEDKGFLEPMDRYKETKDWRVAYKSKDGTHWGVETSPYSARYMYSPSLDLLRKQNEGEWYANGSDSDFFKNGGLTMKTGGVTNEPLYNVMEATMYAVKVSATPDMMYRNITKQGVIDLANSMSYYERMDNDEPEITNFEKAKKFIELEGDWKVVKIAKHGTGTETSEVRFLSKDHSGRGERPYILNESHIRKTWDLKEVGDDDETSLGDFLNNSEPGDKWQSGTESLENLGIGMALGGYTLTKYTKEQEKLLKELDKKFRTEEPGSKERMNILQEIHNVQRMEHGGSIEYSVETEQEPGKYIFKDTEKAMLKNAFLFLKNATQTDDYFVIELSNDGHEYMVDWFALDGTDEGSVGYFKHYDNALKKFNSIREYIKSNWNIVAEKIDVPYEKNESNGEIHYDAPDVMELIGKASKGFKFQPWLYGKRGIKIGSIASWYGNKSQAKRGAKTDNSVQFIDYKGEEIMFESINKEYFVNDLEFKTLAEAKKYIDSGSPLSDSQINLYRHGAMKQGGKLKPYPDLSRKEPMVIKDDLFDTFTPEKPTLIKEKKSKKDTGTLTNIIPQVELVRMGVQTLENIGDRKITSSQSATKILYKVFPKNQIGVQEFYYALYTDRANNVIAYYNLSKGGVSGTIADAELVGSVGIKLLAQGVLVAHNHPSGNLRPSEADIKMALHTKQVLKGLGITLLDSIIIVPGGEQFEGYKYTSLQDEGKI